MIPTKKTYIGYYQFVMLFVGFLYGSTTIVGLGIQAQQDVWIAVLISWMFGFILIYGYTLIAKHNPHKNLVEILMAHFGKYVGGLVSVLYIWYFIHIASLVFRNFGEFILLTILPRSSLVIITSIFAISIAYAIRIGFETTSRVIGILVPIVLLGVILIGALLFNEYNASNLLPVFSNGLSPILISSFSFINFPLGESVVFLMLFPYLNDSRKIAKGSLLGTAIAGLFILLILIRNLLVLGPNLISTLTYPTNTILTLIPGYGLEALFNLSILIGGVTKTSILLFAACTATSQLLNINDYKPYVLPFSAFIVSLSIWVYPNIMEMVRWANEIGPYYSLPFQIIIPAILLILSIIKKKRKTSRS